MPCPTLATVATRSHLAAVRVLFQSVRRWHPEARCLALIVDDPGASQPSPTPGHPFERFSIADLRLPEPDAFCFQYDAFELCNALKPWLLRHLTRQDPETGVVYLDSDIAAYGDLSPLTHALEGSAGFLTPHTRVAYPRDGAAPGARDLSLSGQFNAGVVGVGQGEGGRQFLEWWIEAVQHDALVEPAEGLFVDQRFLDAVACLFPEMRVLRHDGINVAHFNLHARRGDDWWVNEQRLVLFHFTMLRANHGDFRPFVTRPLLEQQPLLRELLGAQCAELREAGHAESSRVPYGLGAFTNGTPISKATRRSFRDAWIRGEACGNPRADPHWMEFEARHRASVIAKTRTDHVLPCSEESVIALRRVGVTVAHCHYHRYHTAEDRDEAPGEHYIAAMCRCAGLTGKIRLRPYLALSDSERQQGRIGADQVVIQTSAQGARFPIPNKEWPAGHFGEVIERLAQHFTVVQLGAAQGPTFPGVVDLRGRTTVREAAGILAGSRLFVGLPGFLMHLARAVETRSVIVFGGREDPVISGYAEFETLVSTMACAPCWRRRTCPYDRECLRAIQPAMVFEAVERAIDQGNPPLAFSTTFL